MAVELEVSLGLWQDRPPEEVIRTAALADALGYRAVWIGEMATWDAFVLGAHVGHSFEHANLVLGPFAVAVRDPAMIAIGVASVAALTGREVSVALGTSSTTVVESWHGRDRGRSGRALAESAARWFVRCSTGSRPNSTAMWCAPKAIASGSRRRSRSW